MSTMSKPVVRLVGEDGNAFAILGRWRRAAVAEGWDGVEVQAVMDEAMSGDYNHLLLTIQANSEEGDEDDETEDAGLAAAEARADEYASQDEPPYGSFPEER